MILNRFAFRRKFLHVWKDNVYDISVQDLDRQRIFLDMEAVAAIEKEIQSRHSINLVIIQRLAADFSGNQTSVLGNHASGTAHDLPLFGCKLLEYCPDILTLDFKIAEFVAEREHRHDIVTQDIALRHVDADSSEINDTDIHPLAGNF